MNLYDMEKVIAAILADGEPRSPKSLIDKALEAERSLSLVKEALWSLIGDGYIKITTDYQLQRIK